MNSFMNPSSNWCILWLEISVFLSSIISNFFLNTTINMIHIYFWIIRMILIFFWASMGRVSFRWGGWNHGNWHSNLNSVSVTLFCFLVNRNRYSSNNRNFLHVRLRYRIISLNFYFIKFRFLNMMYIVLLIVFLNNWLGYSFFTRNGNCLEFLYIVIFTISG